MLISIQLLCTHHRAQRGQEQLWTPEPIWRYVEGGLERDGGLLGHHLLRGWVLRREEGIIPGLPGGMMYSDCHYTPYDVTLFTGLLLPLNKVKLVFSLMPNTHFTP